MAPFVPMQPLSWQIGDIKITSIPETEDPTGPRFIYRDLEKKEVLAHIKRHPWLAQFLTPQGNLILRICSFIVDTGAHRIIIDACVGNEKTRHNQKWNGMKTDLYDRITAAGYHPDSITEVICTHLHDDHCGGCTRKNEHGEWVPVYRNATHIYARTEFEHWRVTPYKDDDLVFQDSVKPVMDAGLAQLVNSEYQVAAGISLFPTPGHTPGHVSVLISSRDKQAIITGDMIHNPLQIAEPTITSIFDSDSAKAVQTRLAFLKKWTDGKTVIIGTHFANPTAGLLVDRGDGHWELDPGPEGARVAAGKSAKL